MRDWKRLHATLDAAREGREMTVPEAAFLLGQTDPAARELVRSAADRLRAELVGERVSYVINRNINFSNICVQHCSFCAFRRDAQEAGAYSLDFAHILQKTAEAVASGATEICMQGGLNPAVRGAGGRVLDYYLQLVDAIKAPFPRIHLHAFSPQESFFIAREDRLPIETVLAELRAAGVDSMPGTAAEVLHEPVRRRLCPEKLSTLAWVRTVEAAHRTGLPMTSTMLSGHIETAMHRAIHLGVLRTIQKRTGGFTEFVLLPYVGLAAPRALRARVGRDQPELADALLTQAVARLFFGRSLVNHQPSWVKLGLEGAGEALRWGCNDIGGTLMEEHITSMAGARGGTCQTPEALRAAVFQAERTAYQRDTLYQEVAAESIQPAASLKSAAR
ncbi:7,8-didemethyl-8-hydroxy-5-deazariboflavin synthase subunit CofH [Gloeobacter violaceus]|uniref:5-amino-6-(D-ribitylamino)uracil--L-tyrosine 4-hydroxyphenyl transferase n=1 Tax=Gloeobacter violaceus (strain ATCC 29082 / PCC 7421) TaxID=251221 RepID=COFH_GLOVI|nr:7,8-didemethyl-8-hydroxy-5-deazariboflavin synthase subunit CofH [Gloeobacter violaceus]Q7NMI9.2 RecName: Full=5-amino-6-(D-ribitylamino)uracil--L-tyrosine 4-hydroxyphenyl transferase; AltName: Full=FO synthase subunit 2 [Gloeobacter violaceus PCC 7421]